MQNFIRHIFALGVIATTSGCAGVTSTPLSSTEENTAGLTYFLPTTRIPFSVFVDTKGDRISLKALAPVYMADEATRLRMSSIYSPLHAETVTLKVNRSGLLTSINFDSEGRLDEGLVAGAKSLTALFAENATAPSTDSREIYSTNLDLDALASSFSQNTSNPKLQQLNTYIDNALKAALPTPKDNKAKKTFLGRAQTLSSGEKIVTIKIRRTFADQKDPSDIKACKVGLCYRLPISYTVSLEFFDKSRQEILVAVPNGSPTYAASLNRGVFSKWSNAIILDNGMLQQYQYVTDASEIEAALSLPFNVVGGLIEGITKNGALLNSKASLITSQIALEKKRQEQRDFEAKAENTLNNSQSKSLFEFVGGAPIPDNFGQRLPTLAAPPTQQSANGVAGAP